MVNWKRVMWIALAFLIIYSNPASCQEKRQEEQVKKPFTCTLATVSWHDAVVYTRHPLADDIDTMTAEVIAVGCVVVTEKTVLVIMNVSQGTPDIFLVIPKDWCTSIVPLKVVEPIVPVPKEVGRAG